MIDLVPRQSLVKWLVDEGRTVFVISWVNPGPEHKDKGVEDYVLSGIVEAVGQVRKRAGAAPDLFSFCLGGTLAAIALAWLAAKGRANEVNSATLIGSLVDFSDMESIGKNNKVIRRELDAASPNLAAVRTAAAQIANLSGKASGWFPAGTGPDAGKTGAKPEIWQNEKDFVAKLSAFQKSARALSATARGNDVPAIKARFADMPAISKFDALPPRRKAAPSAFLSIQEGCDKFCTYCVVPYTRGAEISRPWDHVLTEAQSLVEAGARELVLLGQNVNAWTDGERGLAELIRAIARIDGLERIRYTTSHPADM